MWTLHKQQQHCGAQLHARGTGPRQAGEAPAEATRDRAAQEHDRAGDQSLQPGDYPASPIEHGDHDNTPSEGEGEGEWDQVVQPEQRQARDAHDWDDEPLPEGK
jgi:hypothetical protein